MSRELAVMLEAAWRDLSPAEVLRRAVETFGPGRIAFSTSLGAEDQVIVDLLHREGLPVPVFTLDTGRLPQETYEVLDETRRRYGIRIEVLFPDAAALGQLVTEQGANLFYESIDKRKACCRVRKIEPLRQRLASLGAWICGLRREQSVTRTEIGVVEWDEGFGLVKVNPLFGKSEAWVWEYIREHGVPYNRLHDRGYPSIGCAPCTRAVEPGEDLRSGRWWWESPGHRECGLHRQR